MKRRYSDPERAAHAVNARLASSVQGTRDGSLPASNINISFASRTATPGSPFPSFAGVIGATYSPVSYVDYVNGTVKSVTASGSIVIDRGANEYALVLQDESSTHAIGQSTFHSVVLTYTITDTRPA